MNTDKTVSGKHPTDKAHPKDCRCRVGDRSRVPRINLAKHFMVNSKNANALAKAFQRGTGDV